MKLIINIPDEVFRFLLIPYIDIKDLSNLDYTLFPFENFHKLLRMKLFNIILTTTFIKPLSESIMLWLIECQIYVENIIFARDVTDSTVQSYYNLYHHTKFISLNNYSNNNKLYDTKLLISIIPHWTNLLKLDLSGSININNATIITISTNCIKLQSIILLCFRNIHDSGMQSIGNFCKDLKELNISACNVLTDVSIISITKHCRLLHTLTINQGTNFTNIAFINISKNCNNLKSFCLTMNRFIEDTSIINIINNNLMLKYLQFTMCKSLTNQLITMLISLYINNQISITTIHLISCDKLSEEMLEKLHQCQLINNNS